MIINDTHAPQSVLEERPARLPVSGKIRPGIKILTQKAAAVPEIKAAYDQGIKDGQSFDDIELAILTLPAAKKAGIRQPMRPVNIPYFRVAPGDFQNPDAARLLFGKYAEDGPAGKQVYRIPLVFPVDDMQMILPHGYNHYSASEHLHWSQYGLDGKRMCMMRGAIEMNSETKKARRYPYGRPIVSRGECKPEECPEFQRAECKLTGRIVAYVYGIPGAGVVEIPTTSTYSLSSVRSSLLAAAMMRNNTVSGVREDGQPLFWLSKVKRNVSRIDPDTGKPTRTEQWLIALEADLLLSEVQSEHEALEAPPERAAQPGPDLKEDKKSLMLVLQEHDIDPGKFAAWAESEWGEKWNKSAESLSRVTAHVASDPDAVRKNCDDVPF